MSPERFGRYVLLDRIGEGGMAEVFRAVMPGVEGFKRTLVVKRILASHSRSSKFVDMFVREAHIGSMLNHPGIVQVYDFGNVDGHYFLAMEYLRGRDVLAVIRKLRDLKRPFPVPVAAFIAHEVATCLGYAHALAGPDGRSLDIVHRDVSPSNIMCLREGGVKLLDFGIAKAVTELPEHTEQGAFKGKLAYMPPERMRNEALDGRADLYSLGVVLWEMLACRRLFRGASEVDTFKNILEMRVPPPSSSRPDVPASLDAVVLRALARDRDYRYPTGQAMADDLEEVLRETKFRSRMLPKLLVDLFGNGTGSSQLALSCLTSELLAEMSTPTEGTAGSTVAPAPAMGWSSRWRTAARSLLRSWRGRVVLAAVGVATAILASAPWWFPVNHVSGVGGTERSQPPAALREHAPKALVADPRAPVAVPDSATVASDPASGGGSANAAAGGSRRPKKVALARKPSANARTPNPIGRGLSIDPFKEAASRGRR